ncbi:MAG: mandelate racemase [Acetobacteraceae bacterium]|nr:mandelate racemase [Acetobacteraceae bacterium]
MVQDVYISEVKAHAYKVPTDKPEADGTLSWDHTTLVLAEVSAGRKTGIGYTYSHGSNADLINSKLANAIQGKNPMDVPECWHAMQVEVRNLGRQGLAATAISAVDVALWDLKAKLLDLPLVTLLGAARHECFVYGSGGFTTYTDEELRDQLGGWVHQHGCRWVKMKIGSQPERDPHRVRVAREAIGGAGLFVDANGAFSRKQAAAFAKQLGEEFGVLWFEEPVSSDDLAGLCELRHAAPAPMEIAAGEYGYDLQYFRRMLAAHAVDVLQADVSRCCGVTGFLRVAALCEANQIDLSGHCAPSLHLHPACAAPRFRHLEYFHDHVRIEHMLFDGAATAEGGVIKPDLSRPGIGLEFKHPNAERYLLK